MEAQKPAAKYALSSFFSSRPPLSQTSTSADDRKRKITDKNLRKRVREAEKARDGARIAAASRAAEDVEG